MNLFESTTSDIISYTNEELRIVFIVITNNLALVGKILSKK